MKIVVKEDLCIGCGACAIEVPEIIEMNDDNIAVMLVDSIDDAEVAKAVIASCPVDAILEEEAA